MDTWWHDVRLAARSLARSPAFAVVAVVTLALGIGATTALFAIVYPVLIKPLPYPEADRIVSASIVRERDEGVVPDRWYHAWRDGSSTLSHVAVYVNASGTFAGEAQDSVRAVGAGVSEPFFRVMGVPPAAGRVFRPEEFIEGSDRVVILGHGLWSRAFGADSGIVGREVSLGTARLTVVGVMPPGFVAPMNAEYWRPTRWGATLIPNSTRYVYVLGRLRDGAHQIAARDELTTLATRVEESGAALRPEEPRLAMIALRDRIYGSPRRPLLLFAAGVGALLLIACANVANLGLARALAREAEFGVRAALGARRSRIARIVFAESALLAGAGAAVGLLLPLWALPVFMRFKPESLAQLTAVPLGAPVLVFALAIAAVSAVLLGLAPAIVGSRLQVQHVLVAAGGRATTPRAHQRLRRALVVAQIGATLALVTGAGLLSRSLGRVLGKDPGFDPRHAMIVDITLPAARYASVESRAAFFESLAQRLREIPTVRAVGLSGTAPLRGFAMTIGVRDSGTDPEQVFALASIGSGYPAAIGLRRVAGRVFSESDRTGSGNVVLMSESAARMFFPDGNAVGQVFSHARFPNNDPATVVGVVSDVPQRGLEIVPVPQVYSPLAQVGQAPGLLIVRSTPPPGELTATIRSVVQENDAQQTVRAFTPIEDMLFDETLPRRFSAAVATVFAALALLLAAVGLYGVVAYQLVRRTREFGVRMALGADGPALQRLVVSEIAWLWLGGIAVGLALAVLGARGLSGLLFETDVYDLPTFVAAPFVLAVVAFAASYIPARRATKVDPIDALRAD